MVELTLLIINFLLFHLCWLANAFGAAHDLIYLGPAFVFVSLLLHFLLVENRLTLLYTLGVVTVTGYIVDTLLMLTGVLRFNPDHLMNGFPPLWLLSQWMIFATLFNLALDWLENRWVTASLLGLIGGPASYWGAVNLNALMFGQSYPISLVSIALAWGIIMPFFVWFAHLGEEQELKLQQYAGEGLE